MQALQANSLMAAIRKEERARAAASIVGVRVQAPDNAKGNRVTYICGNAKLAFFQTYGKWVEDRPAAQGRFSNKQMEYISTHLYFYQKLVGA